jgi:hypothetical protein
MIEEFVRQMTADERAFLRSAMGPLPDPRSTVEPVEWGLTAVAVLTGVVIAIAVARSTAQRVIALAAGALIGGWQIIAAAIRTARLRASREAMRAAREAYTAQVHRELARDLDDGRVTVRRVRARAVVEIEALEDEGTGYVFDVGDGRALFIKGQDYFPSEEGMPWPNTEFEIVRAAAGGRILEVHCHGAALTPLRVIARDDVDPQRGWDEREEVLDMSVDDAVRTILRNP